MNDELKDANLELLIGLREHLDHAERVRKLLDRLLELAKTHVHLQAKHPKVQEGCRA